MFFRFIIYSIALYFIMKAIGIVIRYFTKNSQTEKPDIKQKSTFSKVDKKDIVEAEFEEISEEEK